MKKRNYERNSRRVGRAKRGAGRRRNMEKRTCDCPVTGDGLDWSSVAQVIEEHLPVSSKYERLAIAEALAHVLMETSFRRRVSVLSGSQDVVGFHQSTGAEIMLQHILNRLCSENEQNGFVLSYLQKTKSEVRR